jgi:hypothetical protein
VLGCTAGYEHSSLFGYSVRMFPEYIGWSAVGQLEMRKSRGGKTDNLRLPESSKSSGVHKVRGKKCQATISMSSALHEMGRRTH